ncbi:DedA family protein [Candidatus Saccharibacteria bacterium]|nr:DedA family protein [Candidatus Saccharibacteria bacterium]
MFSPEHIIQTGGLLIIALIVFAESGLLIGILLPGDSLLLAAGVFAGHGKLPIVWLIASIIIAAIIGYELGYSIGKKIGPRLFKRHDGFLFREEYLGRTEQFFQKYGPITVIAARFIAHVRTLVSLIAGASSMDRRRYFIYNIVGAVLWGGGLPLLGYYLGSRVPNIDKFIILAVVITLVVLYSLTLWQLMKNPSRRHNLKTGLKADWNYFFGRKK